MDNVRWNLTAHLSELMLPDDTGDLWKPEELGVILDHQLSAAIVPDLERLGSADAAMLVPLFAAAKPLIATFGDLLEHPAPPVEGLQAVKQFAKSARHSPDSPVPAPVATVLYFAAIAVALQRTGQRITSLSPAAIHSGLQWSLDQPWLPSTLRLQLTAALGAMGSVPS